MLKDLYYKLKLYGPKRFIRYSLNEIWNVLYWHGIKKSYSQKQEDLEIDKFLNHKKDGFYVDVGAYDPNRFSNTKRFYKRGWTGINIEPDINNCRRFISDRKRDINLNIGIGNSNEKMRFYVFSPNTLSTFSKKETDEYLKQGFKIEKEIEVESMILKDVLDKYVKGAQIDFFTIDTEGNDLIVLQGNDWNKYRPTLLCVEVNTHGGNRSEAESLQEYLYSIEYKRVSDNGLNAIYLDNLNKK